MPSPFPGMNPYLESDMWPGFHAELAVATKYQLAPRLQPHYYPFVEKYFLLEAEEIGIVGRVEPDVAVVRGERGRLRKPAPIRSPIIMEMLEPLEVPHHRIEIRDPESRQLVTVIEYLSPTNKRGEGRGEYLEKRKSLLRSGVHLVEVDLLRGGTRLPVKGELPAGSYYAFVSRADQRPKTRVWPVDLESPLPTIPVPLRRKREEVPLDLQGVVQAIFDQAGYDTVINYRIPPKIDLDDEELAWLDERLQAVGMRK